MAIQHENQAKLSESTSVVSLAAEIHAVENRANPDPWLYTAILCQHLLIVIQKAKGLQQSGFPRTVLLFLHTGGITV